MCKKISQGWGMGFLLVFFPEEEEDQNQNQNQTQNKFNFFSTSIKRTNSFNLIHKAQSTISICLLLVFTTLLLFTLSTLPSATTATASAAARRLYGGPRRNLRQFPPYTSSNSNLPRALQGMGTLYRRGTRAMNDVVLAHAHDSLSPNELRLFLRLFFRSSLASKSDLLILFPSKTAKFNSLILQEHDSFFKLLTHYKSGHNFSHSTTSFDVTHFTRTSKREREIGEPIWGPKARTNHTDQDGPESNRLSYGSVVGFDADELDPENALSGFVDPVPMGLRRWACYPMLLGRVRRNFKHVVLVDVKDILLLGDPLGRVRSHSPESVLLKVQSNPGKHGKRTELTRKSPVHPGVVMGGSRGVRRFSSAMLTDIVRASIQHNKKKNPFTESGIFNQLVGNDYALKNVNVIVSTESLPELSSLGWKSGSHLFTRNYGLIRRGNSNLDVVNSMVTRHICSFPIDAAVYRDCL